MLVASAQRLIITENLQAAENLAEQSALQPLAIVYSAGQPSAAARRVQRAAAGLYGTV